jgi:CheY-like chemotaxis protein
MGQMTSANYQDKQRVTTPSTHMILIVDDDTALAEMLVGILRHGGYPAEICTHGREMLLQCVREHRPRVLVLEVGTPDRNGWEILRWLRTTPEGERLPVVLTSGGWRATDRFSKIGMTDKLAPTVVLPKPFTLADLQRAFLELGIRG